MYLWTAKVWTKKKKLKMEISMVMMSVRMGCTAVPVNMTIAATRQPCGGDICLSHGKGLSLTPEPLWGPLKPTPPSPCPTYQAQDLDLGVPHKPELFIAVL